MLYLFYLFMVYLMRSLAQTVSIRWQKGHLQNRFGTDVGVIMAKFEVLP
jgi:hypothetical protein